MKQLIPTTDSLSVPFVQMFNDIPIDRSGICQIHLEQIHILEVALSTLQVTVDPVNLSRLSHLCVQKAMIWGQRNQRSSNEADDRSNIALTDNSPTLKKPHWPSLGL